ncbi:hypothetical protein DITRI_Ditri02bG0137000 [Diplodiscus trichospermus]
MFVEFSASTSLPHYVLGWSFNMSGEAESLSLPSPPSLPRAKQKHTVLILCVTFSAVLVMMSIVSISFYLVMKMKNADIIEAWELKIWQSLQRNSAKYQYSSYRQENFSWEERFKIIKSVASGLLNLHEQWEETVICRDIKAGNALLDSELNGRLGDFGLGKLYEHGAYPNTTRFVGTLGYLAPELTKTVVCGRRPTEPKALPEEMVLVDWLWERWQCEAVLEVVDPKLNGEFDELETTVVIKLGLMCSNDALEARPTMRQVVRCLEEEVAVPEVVPSPGGYDSKKGNVGDGTMFEDYVHSYANSSSLDKVST